MLQVTYIRFSPWCRKPHLKEKIHYRLACFWPCCLSTCLLRTNDFRLCTVHCRFRFSDCTVIHCGNGLIQVLVVRMKVLCILDYPKMDPMKILIRLGAHVQRYVFSRCCSKILRHKWTEQPGHVNNMSRTFAICSAHLYWVESSITIRWTDLFSIACCRVGFLAHLSSAQDELLWSLFVRRPSVRPSMRPSVNIFKRLLLWNRWANFAQISYGAFLGWGNEKLLKWSRSIDQDGRHAHI